MEGAAMGKFMKILRQSVLALTVIVGTVCSFSSMAQTLSISNVPLGTGTGVTVRPNLMFILDDSGSMAWDYTPDYVNDSICRDSADSGSDPDQCRLGDPPYSSSGFNFQYYNPAVRYQPAKNADGTTMANATPTAARNDPFPTTGGSTSTKNLTTDYADLVWCTSSDDSVTGPNCKKNTTGYPYPDATYKYRKTTTGAPYYYTLSGTPTWCSDTALTTCQVKRTSTYKYPRFSSITIPAVAGVRATATITINHAGTGLSVDQITIGAPTPVNLLTAPAVSANGSDNSTRRNGLASTLSSAINAGGSGYTATVSSAVVTITAPATGAEYNAYTLTVTTTPAGSGSVATASATMAGGVTAQSAVSNPGATFTRYDIVSGATFPKATARTDCSGATCSYTEELQNFANWYSYYRTRILMTKSASSRAFSGLSDTTPGSGFRVGFMTISSGSSDPGSTADLAIGDFTASQKTAWYGRLVSVNPSSSTPLRGALSKAGQIFAGQISPDPVQFSCQQNFTFMATDGYWNTGAESSSYGPKKENNTTDVGNQDGGATLRPMLDALGKSDTLADVSMYYYQTDLRSAMTNDVPTTSKDTANWQHMTTFTMGLGVDGTLAYASDYETGGSTDYTKIVQGLLNWPDPIANTNEERIDDLWHAAVNGRGTYFSARNPEEVETSLNSALSGISARIGAAAAAATSNLEPVAGDNFIYVASYETQVWNGNLEARTIDLLTGAVSDTAVWSARELLDTKAAAGGRTIYKFDSTIGGTDKKELMTWANLTAAEQAYFNPAQLNQCSPIALCAAATAQNLFDYLLGGADASGVYRARTHVLGDIVNSQPVYVKQPVFSYTDAGVQTGYGTFKATARDAMVYVGANDGMLHAFYADGASAGQERWAYAPSAGLSRLYELANTNYPHRYYVDGPTTVGDVYSGGWKTLLIGGFGGGGTSYYALDITNPGSPRALWEFTDANMGLTYGNPIITKLNNGTWVVLVTSGYNNANGDGILYGLDAMTGAELFRIATGAGSAGNPSGLARINNWVDYAMTDNTTKWVYGGDLLGNLWRFDINAGTVFNVAALGQPITTKPEIGEVVQKPGKPVLFVGTGLFLQAADKSDVSQQSVYAILDDPANAGLATLTTPRTGGLLVQQTISDLVAGATRTATASAVDWNTKRGWFVNLPDAGERVNINPSLQLGTLTFTTNVPDNTGVSSCVVGGYSWKYTLDYSTGSFVSATGAFANIAARKAGSALAVGSNIIRLPSGKVVDITTLVDTKHPVMDMPIGKDDSILKRVSWRELIQD